MVAALPVLLAHAGIGSWRYERHSEQFFFDAVSGSFYNLDADTALSQAQVLNRIDNCDHASLLDKLLTASQGQSFQTRHKVSLDDGSEHWFDWTGNLCTDNDDCVEGICVDITENINSQQRLAIAEQRSHALASGVPGKFGYMNKDYEVMFLSSDYLSAMNQKLEDLVGQHSRIAFGEEMFQKRQVILDRAIAGEVVTFEDESIDTSGNPLYEMVTYQPDYDLQGDICGVFTLRVDISHRRELEQNLRVLSADLERSNADLEQFAYVASHDLKAPLRAIQVLVEWLTEDLEDCEIADVQDNLVLLSKRTSRLNKLLDDLLNYSRAGRQSEPPVHFELKDLIVEITELLNPPEHVQVVAVGDPATLDTDHAAMHQVLRNLIGNAIKHHTGPQARIEVQAIDCGDHHEISVSDDGEGIAEEFAEKIFKMFQTLKPRDEVEGSGMGLAIVERIVVNQGGKIWLDSTANDKGATFKFTWPKS